MTKSHARFTDTKSLEEHTRHRHQRRRNFR
jgi:hypothetical protein